MQHSGLEYRLRTRAQRYDHPRCDRSTPHYTFALAAATATAATHSRSRAARRCAWIGSPRANGRLGNETSAPSPGNEELKKHSVGPSYPPRRVVSLAACHASLSYAVRPRGTDASRRSFRASCARLCERCRTLHRCRFVTRVHVALGSFRHLDAFL